MDTLKSVQILSIQRKTFEVQYDDTNFIYMSTLKWVQKKCVQKTFHRCFVVYFRGHAQGRRNIYRRKVWSAQSFGKII